MCNFSLTNRCFCLHAGPVKSKSRKRRKAPVAKPQSRPLLSEPTSSGVSGGGGEKEGHQTVGEGEGAREGEGEESQLDKAGAYYDKLYFETSSSEDDGEEEEDGGGGTVTDKVHTHDTVMYQCLP